MKKFARFLCAMLVLAMLCVCLIACGDVKSGEYYFGDIALNKNYEYYSFSGSNFTHASYVMGQPIATESYSGTYEVDEEAGTITFTWGEEGAEETLTYPYAVVNEDTGVIKIGYSEFLPLNP